jgi:hypothetical protein
MLTVDKSKMEEHFGVQFNVAQRLSSRATERTRHETQAKCNAQHSRCDRDAASSPICWQKGGVGAPLKGEVREGLGWAPLTNSSHPNFHLFWTQVASTLERAVIVRVAPDRV